MLSLHAKKRIKSRVGIRAPKEQEQFVFDAWLFGNKINDKNRAAIVCYYKDWVLLFGRNNKRLITIYRNEEYNDDK